VFAAYKRHGVIIALAILAGGVNLIVHSGIRGAVALPPVTRLIARTNWRAVAASRPVQQGVLFQEWQMQNRQGVTALLYVGATTKVQAMLHWSGELGYEGVGYQVVQRTQTRITLRDRTTAPLSLVVVQHLADRELLASAIVSPNGIDARSTDNLWRTGWDTLRGADGPYYLVRVSVADSHGVQDARVLATDLLSSLLRALRADIGEVAT
jgi:hypothetical protein